MKTSSNWVTRVEETYAAEAKNYVERGGAAADPKVLESLKHHNDSSDALKLELRKKKLPYIAVLPTSFFQRLVQEAATLYTFSTIQPDGKVKISRYVTEQHSGNVRKILRGFWLAELILLVSTGQLIMPMHIPIIFPALLGCKVFAMSWLLRLLPGGKILGKIRFSIGVMFSLDSLLVATICCGFQKVRDTVLFRLYAKTLWPSKSDTSEAYRLSDEMISLNFHGWTSNILADLKKYGRYYKTYVVADEQSFVVDQAEATAHRWFEPLVCADDGENTVIFSQYGDFPEEKRIIQWVKTFFTSSAVRSVFSKN